MSEHRQVIEWTVSTRTIFRILATTLAFVGVTFIAVTLQVQLTWLAISFFLSLALTPAVNWLARFMPRKHRGLAMGLVLIITIVLFSYLILVLVPPLIEQLITLIRNFPGYWNEFIVSNNFIARVLRELNLTDLAAKNQDKIAGVAGNVGTWIGSTASGIFALVTILVLTFFMVIEGPHWVEIFWRYQPKNKKKARMKLAQEMFDTVAGYVAGNVATSLVAATATFIFLLIMRVPSPLALGLLVGVVDLIPMIGATLAAIVVSLFVLVYSGPTAGIISIIFFIIYQQIENNILQPLVYAKSVNISPLIVGVSALCGAALAGFFGALVAIPVAASAQILVKYWLDHPARNA
ncbi:AI-2E family transporter [Candidatus Saccharibacteria bacterium]|nr:AI-2E family transporter [Candidatus Saccharibacteria bacterium]